MPDMHLQQPLFTYIAWGPFVNNKEMIQNFMQTRDTRYNYRNELDKACFQHDMTYVSYKDFVKRTESDKVWMIRRWKLLVIQDIMVIKED